MRRLINRRPDVAIGFGLMLLPFVAVIIAYMVASDARLSVNPNDKLLPGWSTIAAAIERMAFLPDQRTGTYLLLEDTISSLTRLGIGVAVATVIGGIFGILQGLIPYFRSTFNAFTSVLSMIPPLAVLPILFIVFGLGELAKVVLVAVGIAPFIIRDLALRTEEIPHEEIIKAQTLGASTWQIIVRIVVPQMLPRLIDGVRLSLGAAWLFLIAAEAIASDSGLGYRIFLMRRYLAMDVILPYVAWITFLAFALDLALRLFQRVAFRWMYRGN
ncbi:ABC transporter permease subunit [Parvibaculum sp.]|jgi:NitT/TauT family transport system permease protein|uniref:ABC transporter permease n=1 Tax=Parvibaculum sp. TaxID=2024848 RepID=UPI000C6937AE|nr:ABC transporter permease subunit [Parvibaculum sp.]HAC60187.1 lipid kinase [Rhodobiaceae bacterium]MAU59393.1 lipid kinase [Parvibaculum sp.]MBO6668086.1 ABC transporter permease subunit [Parvibaculum sp.]MBO6692016.1 ABC transporter permease subunit [Parvibaculum sp.]MBO6715598.1 ABC transporter permease subunit [Parvibaculum sp.]|tara:strand:- start:1995 stop:2810 length:816 start_codon:yes stop_codon:yes gene_type:complete